MKHLLITTIVAVVLVGCGESQQSVPPAETEPAEPVARRQWFFWHFPVEAKPDEPVTKAAKPTTPPKAVSANKGADPDRGIKPKPPTAKAPNISIHAAARQGKIEAVKQHLTDGVGVNAKSERRRTPLHSAAREGHKEVIELLIAKGADVNAKDDDGTTPLDMADDKETADLLRKHGGKTGIDKHR